MKNLNIVLQIPERLAARLLLDRPVASKSQAVAIVKDEIVKLLEAFVSDAPTPTKKATESAVDAAPATTAKKTTRKSKKDANE